MAEVLVGAHGPCRAVVKTGAEDCSPARAPPAHLPPRALASLCRCASFSTAAAALSAALPMAPRKPAAVVAVEEAAAGCAGGGGGGACAGCARPAHAGWPAG